MNKLILLVPLTFLLFMASYFLKAHYDGQQVRRQLDEDRVRGEHMTRASSACKDATRAMLAPTPVAGFPVEVGFTGIGEADTGFSYGVVADTGAERHRIRCLMGADYEVRELVRH